MTALLLDAGASPRGQGSRIDPPLQQAAGSGNVAVVRQLLDRGEDPNTAGRDTTALGAAAYQLRTEVVSLLLSRGADASRAVQGSRVEGEGTPLAMALMPDRSGTRDGDARRLQIARLLIERGADVELLISHRAAVDPADALGVTPLHLAVKEGHASVVSYLLDRGADVRSRARDGSTALDLAGDDREMETLLRRHANR
jgi:ankyrin repeat protein